MEIKRHIYFISLDDNLNKLVDKLKTKSYRPNPARKVNILKAHGKLRGLAIANFEDKIVQLDEWRRVKDAWKGWWSCETISKEGKCLKWKSKFHKKITKEREIVLMHNTALELAESQGISQGKKEEQLEIAKNLLTTTLSI